MNANKFILNGEVKIDLSQDTVTEEDVTKGKTFHKADGSQGVGTGGGAELNIAYGDTAPEDTSKLWVKTTAPSGVVVSPNIEYEITGSPEPSVVTFDDPLALSTPRSYVSATAVGDNIYLFGGKDDSGNLDEICRFNTKTKELATLTTYLPTPTSVYTAGIGDIIYVFDGASRSVWYFDTKDETIKTHSAQTPSDFNPSSCIAIGRKIYLFGNSTKIYYFDADQQGVFELGLSFDAVTTQRGACAIDAKIYLFGGTTNSMPDKCIWCLDTKENTLTKLSKTLPLQIAYLVCVPSGTDVYLIGGRERQNSDIAAISVNTIYRFDSLQEETTNTNITLPRKNYGIGYAIIGASAYLFGGYYEQSKTRYDEIMLFSFAVKSAKVADGVLHIVPQTEKNLFNLINAETVRIEIGAEEIYKGNADGIGESVERSIYRDGAWTAI